MMFGRKLGKLVESTVEEVKRKSDMGQSRFQVNVCWALAETGSDAQPLGPRQIEERLEQDGFAIVGRQRVDDWNEIFSIEKFR